MSNKHKVSAVIITYNCADTIEATLKGLYWCDEIIVVDTGSTDHTQSICMQYPCRFSFHPFEGYGAQKQYASGLSGNDWILSIDSDEVLSDRLIEELKFIFSQEDIPYAGFKTRSSLVFMNKVFRFGKESAQLNLRVFNRKYGGFNNARLHEKVVLQGKVKTLKNKILHYSYKDITHYLNKLNSYSSYFAENALKEKKKINKLKILLRFPVTFFITYVMHLNFMNGYPGLIWSVNSAFYSYVKFLKVFEKSKRVAGNQR
jgi:glycosyltransferase involved in cell wall biosynthesis